jgi:AAHS family 4-hydroxybenzoate transporter-like MFS transporter
LGAADIGLIFTAGYAGAILGAVLGGSLADRFGRKPALLGALALTAAATLLSASAASLAMLIALRFVAGVALGGVLPALIALTAEHARPERRAATVTLMYIGYPLGAVIGGGLTAAHMHDGWPRICLYAGSASLIVLGCAAFLPESPKTRQPFTPAAAGWRAVAGSLRTQFADGRRKPALMLWLGLFCTLLLTYFLVSWTPTILVRSGASPKSAALGAVLLNLGGVAGAVLSAPIINRIGAYITVAAMVGCGAVLIAVLGASAGAPATTMAALFLIGVCAIGGQLNFPAMTVQLFPAHVRGAGTGWTMGVGRLGSIVGPLLGGALVAAGLGEGELFALAAIPALVAAAAVFVAARSLPGMQTDGVRVDAGK